VTIIFVLMNKNLDLNSKLVFDLDLGVLLIHIKLNDLFILSRNLATIIPHNSSKLYWVRQLFHSLSQFSGSSPSFI